MTEAYNKRESVIMTESYSMSAPPECVQKQMANVAIRWYAAYSWAYEKENTPMIDDGQYDSLCRWLLDNWDWIKPHDINGYLDKEALEASTAYGVEPKGMTLDFCRFVLRDHLRPQGSKLMDGGKDSGLGNYEAFKKDKEVTAQETQAPKPRARTRTRERVRGTV